MTGATGRGPAVVTGGAGAIGAVLVRTLLARGLEVRVIDNLSSGSLQNLGSATLEPGFRFVRLDVTRPEEIAGAFRGAEDVWHLAANPDIRRGTANPRVDFDQGILSTFNVLDAARSAGVKRVLFSSSSVVYGSPNRFPTPEDYGPLRPESNYGAAKLASEALVSAFAHSYGLRAWIFRFANVVGPGMTHGVLYDLLLKLKRNPHDLEVLGDGRQAKSYLRTEECVGGMLVALERATETVNVLNLGAADRISVRDIARLVVSAVGTPTEIHFTGGERGWTGDIPQQLLAIDRIRALGWSPTLTSAEAVSKTIPELRKALAI